MRQERALAWLERRTAGAEVLIVGETQDVADHLAREGGRRRGATFGWHRFTLPRLAGTLAAPVLADRGLVVASALALEALSARVVRQGMGSLGRFEDVAERPGFPRALARTLTELRLAELGPQDVPDAELGRLLEAYEYELGDAKLADRAAVLSVAASLALEKGGALLGLPLLLADVRVGSVRERLFVAALAQHAPEVLVTIPEGDGATLDQVVAALPRVGVEQGTPDGDTALGRLQAHLFSGESTAGAPGDDVVRERVRGARLRPAAVVGRLRSWRRREVGSVSFGGCGVAHARGASRRGSGSSVVAVSSFSIARRRRSVVASVLRSSSAR
jgi:hypothetical protein